MTIITPLFLSPCHTPSAPKPLCLSCVVCKALICYRQALRPLTGLMARLLFLPGHSVKGLAGARGLLHAADRGPARSQEPLPSLRCPSGCQAQLMKSDRDGFSQTEIPKGDRCLLDGGQRRSINVTGFLHCCPQLSALLSSPRGRRHAFPYLFCGHLAFLYEGIWC